MTCLLRPFIAFALTLSLTLTSGAMAVARGQATDVAGQMVLCTGTGAGPVTVLIDSEGNPVGPHHICPDCALALFSAPMPGAPDMPTPQRRAMRIAFASLHSIDIGRPVAGAQARGPPAA